MTQTPSGGFYFTYRNQTIRITYHIVFKTRWSDFHFNILLSILLTDRQKPPEGV